MLIAGEPSGDLLAAELVSALRQEFNQAESFPTTDYQPLTGRLAPIFFGAGGPCMAAAGVSLAFDMTEHSVIGLTGVVKNYGKFRRLFKELYQLALQNRPDAIICVDFSGFNRRFAHAIRAHARKRTGWFHDWNPRIIQYVSPQVWASREGRAYQLARDYDLLLTIFPFEKAWYAERLPGFPVEFVGHPILDRYQGSNSSQAHNRSATPVLTLLPGSRPIELLAHLPVMLSALDRINHTVPNLRAVMVLPNQKLLEQASSFDLPGHLQLQNGALAKALAESTIAIASTGTITIECAYFGVPTVAMYKSSWLNYEIARRIVKVNHLAMPNLLAGEEVFPEYIQQNATAENISRSALELLQDESKRKGVRTKLAGVMKLLGTPGANQRAARAIVQLIQPNNSKKLPGS
jgi:lipid-A-disaccharide synthase